MAIWDYIATYNPTGFYEDNRARTLRNDYMDTQISAAKNANEREAKIMALEDAWANGDADALRKLGIYAPEKRGKMIDNEEKMLEYARPLAQSFLQVAPENRAKAWGQIYNKLSGVMDMSDMSREYTPEIDSAMELIANSDAQKIRDERIDAMNKENATIAYGRDLEKMSIANEYQKERDEASFNRDIAKLQYAYDRADQKTKEAIDFITLQLSEGNIDRETALSAAGKALGVEITAKDPVKEMQKEYLNESTTPERRNEILSLLHNYTRATNSSKTSTRTPAQEFKDMYGAGFTPESIVKFSQTGDINDLEARPVQGGSIAADVQKYNMYNQEKARKEGELGRPLNEQEDLDLQGKIGIDSFEIKNAMEAIKNGYKLEQIGAQTQGKLQNTALQGQNAIDLENVKQGNRITMADVTEANAEKLENVKQANRVALRYIDDKISEGKELRELNNDKALAEYKNSLPTAHLLELGRVAEQLAAQGTPRTVDQLLAEEYMNGLKTAELERQYKQAQAAKAVAETEKTLAELPFAGQTNTIKEANWLETATPEQRANYELANKNKGTNVTVNNNEQDSFEKELGKETAKKVLKNMEEIDNLQSQLGILDEMERAVSNDNTYQGAGGFIVNDIKTLLSTAGFDTEGLDNAAIINTGASMLMGQLRKDLMPGPLSDRDLRFLIAMTPSLNKTPKQNKAIIGMYRKAYIRQAEYMQSYNDYVEKNRTSRGWKEWAEANGLDKEIFTAEERARAEGKPSGTKSTGTSRNGKVLWEVAE